MRTVRQHHGVQMLLPGMPQPVMVAASREVGPLWHQFPKSERRKGATARDEG